MSRRRGRSTCWSCGGPIYAARVVINACVVCPDCAYRLEHDIPIERVSPSPPRSPEPPQEETLFPLALDELSPHA